MKLRLLALLMCLPPWGTVSAFGQGVQFVLLLVQFTGLYLMWYTGRKY